MTDQLGSPSTPARKGKGKSRAVESHDALIDSIQDAMESELPHVHSPGIDSVWEGPSAISPPARAHHPTHIHPQNQTQPRLLTQLARSTLPTAGLSRITSGGSPTTKRRSASHSGLPRPGEASSSRNRTTPTVPLSDSVFPDLDPTTGLPIIVSGGLDNKDGAQSLHLQRTITDLLQAGSPKTSPAFSYLPSMPSLPSLPKLPGLSNMSVSLPRVGLPLRSSLDLSRTPSRRSISSTATNEDWSSWATGWWYGNKGKMDQMMDEEDRASTVEEEAEKHRRKYRTPKNPIVFCHGLLGFDYVGPASLPSLQISHWRGIREVLEANGAEVLIGRVPATGSIQERASILEELIAEKYPGREVNLIGHSMGGLDCRYLISQYGSKRFRPVSLTTISTPHRGSPFADYVIDNVIGRERLPNLLSILEAMKLPHSGDGSAFNALGTRAMREFNAEVLNREDVSYYSWGASCEPGLLDTFRWPHSVIMSKEGPNDGLVSVQSAQWGEYRGTLLGVNHLDLCVSYSDARPVLMQAVSGG